MFSYYHHHNGSSRCRRRRRIKILRCYSTWILYYLRYGWGDSILLARTHPNYLRSCPCPCPSACLLSKLSSTCQNNNQPYNANRSPISTWPRLCFPHISFQFVSFMVCGLTFQFLNRNRAHVCVFCIFFRAAFLRWSRIFIKVYLEEMPRQKHCRTHTPAHLSIGLQLSSLRWMCLFLAHRPSSSMSPALRFYWSRNEKMIVEVIVTDEELLSNKPSNTRKSYDLFWFYIILRWHGFGKCYNKCHVWLMWCGQPSSWYFQMDDSISGLVDNFLFCANPS